MDDKTLEATVLLDKAYRKYASDRFSVHVYESIEFQQPVMRIVRFENGQIRDVMERRQTIIPEDISVHDLRYTAFLFGMARAARELAEQKDYEIWFDDVICLELLELEELRSEDDFYLAALDVEGVRFEAHARGACRRAAEHYELPYVEDPDEEKILYVLWDRAALSVSLWDYMRYLRSIGYVPRRALFDYVLAILEEELRHPHRWYPAETVEERISGPLIYASVVQDAMISSNQIGRAHV